MRPFGEASILAVVLGLNCLCGCKLGSVKLREAAGGATAAILVDAKENFENFCVLKSVTDQSYVSLLLCVVHATMSKSAAALEKAKACELTVKLRGVLYSRRTKWPITTKVSLQ